MTSRWGKWTQDTEPLEDGGRVWGNGFFTVIVRQMGDGPDGPLHLSIHDRHRTPRHDWRDFQRIKNDLAGPEREAVELYPAESRVVDTANQFHLWVWPAGERIGLGWNERSVADEASRSGARQRPREG